MNVRELIEALSEMDPKAPVVLYNPESRSSDDEWYEVSAVRSMRPQDARWVGLHKNTVTLG